MQTPNLLVGEIGLDKAKLADKWETQLRVFESQMKLAAEMRRPVSMHCVRAYGTIYDWLKQRPTAAECPPSLAFHSYTGSPEMASAFLALPHLKDSIFFGISASVCLRSPAAETKLCNVLRVLPRESLLLESDLDDRNAVPAAMTRVCAVVARAVGMERQALAETTTRNAERFLRRTLI
jgi:TatD DNase family protein